MWWKNTPGYNLNPEDIDAIMRNHEKPELIQLGLALHGRDLSSEQKINVAVRTAALQMHGNDTEFLLQRYRDPLRAAMLSTEGLGAFIASSELDEVDGRFLPEDEVKPSIELDRLISLTHASIAKEFGEAVDPLVSLTPKTNRGAYETALYEGVSLAKRQRDFARTALEYSQGNLVAEIFNNFHRRIRGLVGDVDRLSIEARAAGAVQDQMLLQRAVLRGAIMR